MLTDSRLGSCRLGLLRRGPAFGQQRVDVGGPAFEVCLAPSARAGRVCSGRADQRGARGRRRRAAGAGRVDRPHRFDDVVAQRVRLAVGRRGRPLLDHAARFPGRRPSASMMSLSSQQEVRRAARFGAGGAPMVSGQQQRVLGAGERDVQQPALLVDAALVELALVGADAVRQLFSVVDGRRVQHRHPVLRPSWRGRRAAAAAGRPASVSQVRVDAVDGNTRALRCGTATTCHSRPLAACTVRICTRSCAPPATSRGRQPVFDTCAAASR